MTLGEIAYNAFNGVLKPGGFRPFETLDEVTKKAWEAAGDVVVMLTPDIPAYPLVPTEPIAEPAEPGELPEHLPIVQDCTCYLCENARSASIARAVTANEPVVVPADIQETIDAGLTKGFGYVTLEQDPDAVPE